MTRTIPKAPKTSKILKIPKISKILKTTAATDYEVGRGKPPKASRFTKGQSGNPGGRKKGSLNLKTMFCEALEASMEITQHGRKRTAPTLEALMHCYIQEGLRGDWRAIERLFERYKGYVDADVEQVEELPENDLVLLEHGFARMGQSRDHAQQDEGHDHD
ncbi:DUF5681 domain-containing protein [Bosea sp. PAMC 26642]|uniref:DUF5681 domain-containing protein n=1 Tax=Bosea sp. (strain PAMC 26642) TaxID=1792307 RepID=UPI0007705361|nr:DUF5681 domain-containing protein [Bosea sp. PAMC 26642]AMJ61098.1 hypothetical protein AXW83_13065 [Bosea sp. PAMC 26642]